MYTLLFITEKEQRPLYKLSKFIKYCANDILLINRQVRRQVLLEHCLNMNKYNVIPLCNIYEG